MGGVCVSVRTGGGVVCYICECAGGGGGGGIDTPMWLCCEGRNLIMC